jgi:hypothetical protein
MSCHVLGRQLGHTNEGQAFSTKGFKWSSMGRLSLNTRTFKFFARTTNKKVGPWLWLEKTST